MLGWSKLEHHRLKIKINKKTVIRNDSVKTKFKSDKRYISTTVGSNNFHNYAFRVRKSF